MEQETTTLVLNAFDIKSTMNETDYYNTTIDNLYGTIANNRCTNTLKM